MQPQTAPVATDAAGYPIDYLNQIAPSAQQRTINRFALVGIIISVLVVMGFGLFMTLGGGTPNTSAQSAIIQERLRTLKQVSKEQQPHLKENEISSMNATLTASITSMDAELASLLSSSGKAVKVADRPKEEKEVAYYGALSKKLNDAYLLGTLDRSYATEMTYQLTILKGQLQKLRSIAKSKSVTEYYTKNVETLDTIIKRFSEFQGTK